MENLTLTERLNSLEREFRKEIQKNEKLDERLRAVEVDKSLNEYQFKQIMNTLTMLQNDITELKEKPAKRWDLIITGIITAVVSFLMALLLK